MKCAADSSRRSVYEALQFALQSFHYAVYSLFHVSPNDEKILMNQRDPSTVSSRITPGFVLIKVM